jgi:hypothetical protein
MSFTLKLARRAARLRASVCGALVLSALACHSEEATAPDATPSSVVPAKSDSSAADSAGAESAPVDSAAFDTLNPALLTSSTAPGVPFGDFHLPTYKFRSPYTGALLALFSSSASSVLNLARNTGMRVVISVAGNRKNYTNWDGTFNMTKWKSRVAAWRSFPFSSYVGSGTVIGHYLVDEPTCLSCWGGRRITIAQIEEMARYSKSIWPSLPTTVRAAPTKLDKIWYRYLDFAWAQWEGPYHGTSFRLTPSQFRDKEIAAAKARGLGVVFGLNYANGGNGSSGILGTYPNARQVNRWQMSASEVKQVGGTLAAASYACGVVSWKFDPIFLSRSGMTTAMSYVSGVARNRARSSCKK